MFCSQGFNVIHKGIMVFDWDLVSLMWGLWFSGLCFMFLTWFLDGLYGLDKASQAF